MYLATFWAGLSLRFAYVQWTALLSVCIATGGVIAFWHHRTWDLGLRTSSAAAFRELGGGIIFGAVLILAADIGIRLLTQLRHVAGRGFPFAEMLTIFIPAALHEELLFRGYPYQLLRRSRRWFAIVASSVTFGALHLGNNSVTPVAMVNIVLGGVVLCAAYELRRRLWMPIGLHLAWNVVSGPILGYQVSGYAPARSILATVARGPAILTGGAFGIEGSLVMTGIEAIAAVVLWRMRKPNEESTNQRMEN